MNRIVLLFFCTVILCTACHKEPSEEVGTLILNFAVQEDNHPVNYHELLYMNEAGNRYQVDEVRFFISEVRLIDDEGNRISIMKDDGIHYFDSDILPSATWKIDNELAAGVYDSIVFVFGLPKEKNVTGWFVNAPEANMAWPDVLGGGYHYMQINGKWLATNDSIRPFNLHTGIGQVYEGSEAVQFVDNSFEVKLSLNQLKISGNAKSFRTLVMNVENWMRSPNVYDFNEWGGAIMQNQAAQEVLRENAHDVFSISH